MGSIGDGRDSPYGSPREYYNRAKALININAEKDPLTLLKSTCLMSWWAARANDTNGLDTVWHWTGVATKLTMLLGLHRERSYRKWEDKETRGCCKRIW
jgi:hypothetical protein